MSEAWPDKLRACNRFDDQQKATIRGSLLALELKGGDPNAAFKGNEEQIRLCLDRFLQDAVPGWLPPILLSALQ